MSKRFISQEAAQVAADKLAAILEEAFGGEWETKVHNNLGWYMCVKQGNLAVSPSLTGSYYVYLGTNGTGMAIWHLKKAFLSPVTAVQEQILHAREVVKRLIEMIPGGL